ncbi:hypothetical protein GGQ68_000668 [Sagittula marina]|uniref:Uncharacterized protein n=1 Tax=Sagittula marina TaxID=943940 RepID=A0A7W6DP61_9RHOB|nr:hypothetical protein [Sagittula marina]MBB3984357.1 hypothetical protein [Sagittula marina]
MARNASALKETARYIGGKAIRRSSKNRTNDEYNSSRDYGRTPSRCVNNGPISRSPWTSQDENDDALRAGKTMRIFEFSPDHRHCWQHAVDGQGGYGSQRHVKAEAFNPMQSSFTRFFIKSISAVEVRLLPVRRFQRGLMSPFPHIANAMMPFSVLQQSGAAQVTQAM